ncbi:hypothetical protein BABINDRAFT_47743 [Babjeviella inositovora NRRL Y-12698]|uniref:Fe2OG dioxygenase domain-containing protein n=1 Tax=Babjeviella inositovora NRRL Y-12698 TaxID=984486 RepID=A0A1E3QSM0_9ASCO|nr:uncharacterized protein BABINDRAFT_47743 [Babjeviella inositovora NRRL Y-12698]ODQ80638.1 hypothetical protein BABINDRAFT_47743 [Babjeviella inositovora NRRL Y-12698]
MFVANNPLQIVDISTVNQATADDLFHAAASQGFLFVEGHNFSQKEVDVLFQLSQAYFAQSAEEKRKYPIDSTNAGYTDFGGENLDPETQKQGDPKEGFNFSNINFETGLPFYQNIPPFFAEDPEMMEIVQSAAKKFYAISVRIFKLLSIGMKIEDTTNSDGSVVKGEDWLTVRHQPTKESGSTFRFLRYPGQKSLNPEAVIRAGAHTDYGGVTLLFQKENQEGLEIHSPVSKKWEAVPYVGASPKFQAQGAAPPIVVNIADQLSYWTSGILKSTIHRVRFPAKSQETGQDRYSIVFFSHPNDETLLEPVPSPIIREVKNRGANAAEKVVTAHEHLQKRLAATYSFY